MRKGKVEYIYYRGTQYWVQTCGRYFQSRVRVSGERLLHRRIWADQNGPIPAAHDIHHKDKNWRNNHIDNLELLLTCEHRRHHMRERVKADPAWHKASLEAARIAAAKWHASEVGRAWHGKHAKAVWENRKPVGAVCTQCNAAYWTFRPEVSRFCSIACRQAVGYRRYFTSRRACDWCGKAFTANRHRATACCSRICANRKRAADERLL